MAIVVNFTKVNLQMGKREEKKVVRQQVWLIDSWEIWVAIGTIKNTAFYFHFFRDTRECEKN